MKKHRTKFQIITELFKDGFINGRVYWNLLGSKFKKHEIEIIDRTARKYRKPNLEENK